jgi:hypothetical protein
VLTAVLTPPVVDAQAASAKAAQALKTVPVSRIIFRSSPLFPRAS